MQVTQALTTHLRSCGSFSVLMYHPWKFPARWKRLERAHSPGPPPPLGSSHQALTQSLQGPLRGTSRGCWLINVDA